MQQQFMQPPVMNPYAYAAPMAPPAPQQTASGGSAVSINIYDPKSYSGQDPAYTAPMYNYPQSSMYSMPMASAYGAPMMTPPPTYNMPMMTPMPAYAAPMMTPPPAPAMAPMPEAIPPAPAPAMAPMPEAIPPAPVAAAPVPPMPEAPVDPAAAAAAAAPAAAIGAASTAAVPAIDIAQINSQLASANLDEQSTAIQKIAELGQAAPATGESLTNEQSALLNEETFKNLAAIVSKDTSSLQGADKEKAETNKMIGMWTLAVLQKNFRKVMDEEAGKQGLPPVSITDLPEMDKIVLNIKQDPNPAIREAGVSALTFPANKSDKDTLSQILKIVEDQDKDKNVKSAAKEALKSLPA